MYTSVGQLRLLPFLTSNIRGPFHLSVDWITDKLYLVQKTLARIDVFSSNGQNRTALLTSNIFNPSSLSLDPNSSYLFLSDLGNPYNKAQQGPRIERVSMDGSQRQIIVKDKLLAPVALTVDPIKKFIYWIDMKYDHLESCDYYGRRRRIIAQGSRLLPHTLSLDLYESSLYLADQTKMSIMKLERHSVFTEPNLTYHYKQSQQQLMPKFIRIYHQTKQLKERSHNPCSINNGGCSHMCLLSHGQTDEQAFRCKCRIGYQLARDLKSCVLIKESLYIAQSKMIRSVSMDANNQESESRVPILMPKLGSSIRSIELDCRQNLTFYFDSIRRAIFMNKAQSGDAILDNEGETKVLVPDNLVQVESMVFDWVSRNLYFTNVDKISVIQVDQPRHRRDIIYMRQVFALALDPNSGYLFFSTLDRPANIYRSFLDGTNLTVIVQRGLSMPYSLSVDYVAKKLYWADSNLAKIQYSDFNGQNLVTLFSAGLAQPISLALYKFNLFFLDSRLNNLYKASKVYSTQPVLIRSNMNGAYQVKIQSSDLYQSNLIDVHPCSRQNGDCSHFCFAVPSLDPQYKLSRHCGCPFGMSLDSANLHTCVRNESESVFQQATDLCKPPYLFKCANNRCVRRMDVCDGMNDCLDFSDETNCPSKFIIN
jgi:low density lipoprotein-related protein 2